MEFSKDQSLAIIITAIVILMLLVMISLPTSYYEFGQQYQPSSFVSGGEQNHSQAPIHAVVRIVYTTS